MFYTNTSFNFGMIGLLPEFPSSQAEAFRFCLFSLAFEDRHPVQSLPVPPQRVVLIGLSMVLVVAFFIYWCSHCDEGF